MSAIAMREVTAEDIESLAVGAWILGTGGGGSPYLGLLNMRRLYAEGRRVRLMSPDALADDDAVAVVSNQGAPLVGQERHDRVWSKMGHGWHLDVVAYCARRPVFLAAGEADGGEEGVALAHLHRHGYNAITQQLHAITQQLQHTYSPIPPPPTLSASPLS
jgi:hypothetical protein